MFRATGDSRTIMKKSKIMAQFSTVESFNFPYFGAYGMPG
jgi:hypothetical protein